MTNPYVEGAKVLLQEHSVNDIAVVVIPSRLVPHSIEARLYLLQSCIGVPESRIFTYVPPDEVSHKRYKPDGTAWPYREEKIPIVRDPRLTYIVLDDILDTGRTLQRAAVRLEEQGVHPDNIWFFGCVVDEGCFNVLDKAKPLIAHLKPLNQS